MQFLIFHKIYFLTFLYFASTNIFSLNTFQDGDDENLTVTINTGIVQGRLRRTEGTNKIYYSFQGIPYAEPPVKDLRFRVRFYSVIFDTLLVAFLEIFKHTDYIQGVSLIMGNI